MNEMKEFYNGGLAETRINPVLGNNSRLEKWSLVLLCVKFSC